MKCCKISIKVSKKWQKLVKSGGRWWKLVKMFLVHISSTENGGIGTFWVQKLHLKDEIYPFYC